MPQEQGSEVPPVVAQTKQWRQDLDLVLQRLKAGTNKDNLPAGGLVPVVRASRERSLAITKIQEAIMWLGMDLKAIREENPETPGTDNPYPASYDPGSPAIEPTADNLKL